MILLKVWECGVDDDDDDVDGWNFFSTFFGKIHAKIVYAIYIPFDGYGCNTLIYRLG